MSVPSTCSLRQRARERCRRSCLGPDPQVVGEEELLLRAVAGLAVDRAEEPIGPGQIGIEQERAPAARRSPRCVMLGLRVALALLKEPLRLGVAGACLKSVSANGAGACSRRLASLSARALRAGSASGRAAKRRYSPIASSYWPASVKHLGRADTAGDGSCGLSAASPRKSATARGYWPATDRLLGRFFEPGAVIRQRAHAGA